MKKLVCFLFIVISTAFDATAAATNPFTGKYNNQMSFFVAQGVDSGFIVPPPARFVPFNILHLQYSQPTNFFRLPARQSLNIAQTIGFAKKYGWNWDSYITPMLFLSEDISLARFEKFFFATGVGIGLQAQQNERLGAKLLFQFKLIAGWHISDKWGLELFMQHFSNANTSPKNYSYGFYGIGVTYNF
ncbi:MAG: acyloxyacyl hydrolase [Alphaproteobacteria bacterium]|nr:acyloxyacyl hydrolase [Alphaproteobacteria bacterium]